MKRSRFIAGSLFACFAVLAGCAGSGDHSAGDGYATSSSDEEALTKVCGQPTTGPVQGYDVSTYQGAFTWAGKGVKFGAARISDGINSVDGQFDGNWARMKSAGVLRAAYQFFEPGQNEVTQANMVIAKVGKLGAGDLPVMLDVEVTGGQSPATIRTKAQHWLDLVEAGTGKRPFVYSYGSFLETNLGSGFGKYPLWIANYGATCPSVPNGWTNWVMWQYSDGSGSLDHDVFNGNLAQLQALAGAAAPRGYLDAADCTSLKGWAQDQSAPTASIDVDLFADVQLGAAGAVGYPILASVARPDVATAFGSPNHGFDVATPLSLLDTKPHTVYVYGIPSGATAPNGMLTDAPKSLTCPLAKIPLAPENAVKRHIIDLSSLAAWKLSPFWSLSQQTPTTVAEYKQGDDLEAAPTVVQADDGSAEIYVIDGGKKRHVMNLDSLTAWHFTVVKMEAAKLAAIGAGADWELVPFMLEGQGDPAIYLLDVDPSTPAGTGGGAADGGLVPTGSDPGTGAPAAPAVNDDSSSGGDSDGCAVANAGSRNAGGSLALVGIALGLALVARRRRRD